MFILILPTSSALGSTKGSARKWKKTGGGRRDLSPPICCFLTLVSFLFWWGTVQKCFCTFLQWQLSPVCNFSYRYRTSLFVSPERRQPGPAPSPQRSGSQYLETPHSLLLSFNNSSVFPCRLPPPWRWELLPAVAASVLLCSAVCLVTQLCLTLCSSMDCVPPGSSVHGILQARILERVVIFLLQGIFLTQGSNPCLLGLLHWQVGSLPPVPPGKSPWYCSFLFTALVA